MIHLPGLHGDWTLLAPFRHALNNRARFVETTYPRQPDWTLDDYATAIESALLECEISSGWILGESFSSQVAWSFLHRQQQAGASARFRVEGLILVGGFMRHPWPWGVRLAQASSRRVPLTLLRFLCQLYSRGAKKRFHHCPGAAVEFDEFTQRRANTKLPVFHLTGAWDPIVPWWHVRPWLRKNCPGYRGTRIIWSGGHNVLLSSPQQSAEQILSWVKETRGVKRET